MTPDRTPGEGRFFLTVPYANGGVTKMAMAGIPDGADSLTQTISRLSLSGGSQYVLPLARLMLND
jgi:hypothetical protein